MPQYNQLFVRVCQVLVLFLALLLSSIPYLTTAHITTATTTGGGEDIFLVISKLSPEKSEYYAEVEIGCVKQARAYNAKCVLVGPTYSDANKQAEILEEYVFLLSDSIKGIAISGLDYDIVAPVIQDIKDRYAKPILVFDSDSKYSDIATASIDINNKNAGTNFGDMLLHLDAEIPGRRKNKYAVISSTNDNFADRVQGVHQVLMNDTKWELLEETDCGEDPSQALEQLSTFLNDEDVGAIISVGGWVTSDIDAYQRVIQENEGKDVITIVADGTPSQLASMYQGSISAIIAQDCRGMGKRVIEQLNHLGTNQTDTEKRISLDTYPIKIMTAEEMESISDLKYMGFIAFCIIAILSVGFSLWTVYNGKNKVVKASQPIFLHMVCYGTLTIGSSIIPMTIIDKDGGHTQQQCNIACNFIFPLVSVGFIITFSALFSKLWRMSKVFNHSQTFNKIEVKVKDVMVPFVVLLTSVLVVLIIWTTNNAPIYSFEMNSCFTGTSSGHMPYMITIIILVTISVIGVVYQAYQCREIVTDFNESKYIGIIVLSLTQILVLGAPILLLTRHKPRMVYIISVIFIFTFCILMLLLIFVPKMFALYDKSAIRRTVLYGFRSKSVIMDEKSKRVLIPPLSSRRSILMSKLPNDMVCVDEDSDYEAGFREKTDTMIDYEVATKANGEGVQSIFKKKNVFQSLSRNVSFRPNDYDDSSTGTIFYEVEFLTEDYSIAPRRSSILSRASDFRRTADELVNSLNGVIDNGNESSNSHNSGARCRSMKGEGDDLFVPFGVLSHDAGAQIVDNDEDKQSNGLLAMNAEKFKSCREFEDDGLDNGKTEDTKKDNDTYRLKQPGSRRVSFAGDLRLEKDGDLYRRSV